MAVPRASRARIVALLRGAAGDRAGPGRVPRDRGPTRRSRARPSTRRSSRASASSGACSRRTRRGSSRARRSSRPTSPSARRSPPTTPTPSPRCCATTARGVGADAMMLVSLDERGARRHAGRARASASRFAFPALVEASGGRGQGLRGRVARRRRSTSSSWCRCSRPSRSPGWASPSRWTTPSAREMQPAHRPRGLVPQPRDAGGLDAARLDARSRRCARPLARRARRREGVRRQPRASSRSAARTTRRA